MKKSNDNQPRIKVLGRLDIKGLDIIKRIYSVEGLAPTLSTMMGGAGDVCCIEDDGLNDISGLEDHDDWDGVLAWAEMPKYKGGNKNG